MLRSELMINKLEDDKDLNKSLPLSEDEAFEIEMGDKESPQIKNALSQHIEDPDKELECLVIEEVIPVHPPSIQKSSSLVDDESFKISEVSSPSLLKQQSDVSQADQARITYIDQMHSQSLSDDYRQNLLQLMNMGFMDFKHNLKMLKQNKNNIDVTCTKMLGLSEN